MTCHASPKNSSRCEECEANRKRTERKETVIEFKVGDIFAEDVEALVNTVNCVGVMGRGVALQFKRAFPENFKAYAKRCKRNEMQPGRVFVFETANLGNPRYIVNFPTKRHWRGKSRTEDIESGLKSLIGAVEERGIRSIALPSLGSGLGGLDWARQVRPMLTASLAELPDVRFVVFEPGGGLEDHRANRSADVPKTTPARGARKRRFTERQLRIAAERLHEAGWIGSPPLGPRDVR